ncbi:MAG: formyltransferase family protein [Candidatus Paceibacterota bacterium]|jgi:folate-dependent phosphoribosylglycinamide formyltransferase PurN
MKKLKIVALFSGGASSLKYLYENDPNCGHHYEFVCGISNKRETKGEKFCIEKDIPFIEFNTKKFCVERKYLGKLRKMPKELREDYYFELLNLISPFAPDIILLSGFMLEIVFPLLGYCPIINVHPADMRIKDAMGKTKYVGDDAVTLAINAGEKYTASTIHVVEEELDNGRIICVSDPLPVELNIFPWEHQEKMKMLCDGPAYRRALEMIYSKEFIF